MPCLVILPAAQADLIEIGDFIAQDNPERALSFSQRDTRLHPRSKTAQEDCELRQAPIQTAQPHRDHVRSPEGLAARRHTIRPLSGNVLLCDHARRNRPVLAVKFNESGP